MSRKMYCMWPENAIDWLRHAQTHKFQYALCTVAQAVLCQTNVCKCIALRSCFKLKDDNSFTLVSTQTKIHKLILPLCVETNVNELSSFSLKQDRKAMHLQTFA